MKRLVLTLSIAATFVAGCSKPSKGPATNQVRIRAKVTAVQPSPMLDGLELTGIVVATKEADICSQIQAPIISVSAHEGDLVRQGEVLVRLSSASSVAAVQQSESQWSAAQQQQAAAEAERDLATATYARYDTLMQHHSITPHEFDEVRSQMQAAQAHVLAATAQSDAAKAALHQGQASDSYTVIRAPFSGRIAHKFSDPGAIAIPGVPLLHLEDSSAKEIQVQVNESALAHLRAGVVVPVHLAGEQSPVTARVATIVPAGDPTSHTFTVKLALPVLPSIYSGMTASVDLPGGETTALLIPRSSVFERGQLDAVLVLDQNEVANVRYVSLGRAHGDSVQVFSGLRFGDWLLTTPDEHLIGRRIEGQL